MSIQRNVIWSCKRSVSKFRKCSNSNFTYQMTQLVIIIIASLRASKKSRRIFARLPIFPNVIPNTIENTTNPKTFVVGSYRSSNFQCSGLTKTYHYIIIPIKIYFHLKTYKFCSFLAQWGMFAPEKVNIKVVLVKHSLQIKTT